MTRLLRLLARRAALAIVSALLVSSLTVVLALHAPGDHVTQVLNIGASAGTIERARQARGLDVAPSEQFRRWAWGVLRLDLGTSVMYQRPVAPLVAQRTANTLLLAVAALALAAAIGLPLGVASGSHPGALAATMVRTVSIVGISLPPLLGSLLLVWLAASLGLLPSYAAVGGRFWYSPPPVSSLALPVLALALPLAAALERLQAEAMRRALGEPCLTAALARGVSWRRVVWVHGLRLGAGSVLGVAGVLAGSVLSGSVAVELVTTWPGLGRLSYEAFVARDVHLAAACAGVAALVLAAAVTASDVALTLVDARARDSAWRAAGAAS